MWCIVSKVGEGKGREGKGGDPQGLVDMFKILKNTPSLAFHLIMLRQHATQGRD